MQAQPAPALTPRQAALLKVVCAFTAERGFAPTYREIADGIGVKSVNQVSLLVNGLVERGHVRRIPMQKRGLRVVSGICPCCGRGGT